MSLSICKPRHLIFDARSSVVGLIYCGKKRWWWELTHDFDSMRNSGELFASGTAESIMSNAIGRCTYTKPETYSHSESIQFGHLFGDHLTIPNSHFETRPTLSLRWKHHTTLIRLSEQLITKIHTLVWPVWTSNILKMNSPSIESIQKVSLLSNLHLITFEICFSSCTIMFLRCKSNKMQTIDFIRLFNVISTFWTWTIERCKRVLRISNLKNHRLLI